MGDAGQRHGLEFGIFWENSGKTLWNIRFNLDDIPTISILSTGSQTAVVTASQALIRHRDLAIRCHEAWIALPPHTRYNKETWTSNNPPEVCFMQGKVYLAYLQMQFQILRLLGEGSTTSSPELLGVSADMLETTIEVANPRGRASYFPRDLPGIVSFQHLSLPMFFPLMSQSFYHMAFHLLRCSSKY
jgi:hypothetical protein